MTVNNLVCAIILLLPTLLPKTFAQVYGDWACPGGGYCGQQVPNCTAQESADALYAVQQYFSYITDYTNNYNNSMSYTTGDGDANGNIPPFQFNWHGPTSLIPIAGTYTGQMALSNFFGEVGKITNSFTFATTFSPNSGGVIFSGSNCQFVFVQWQEQFKSDVTGKTMTYGYNTVRYTLLNHSYPKIAIADVWVNSGSYQDVFCPGQTNCNGYSSDDNDDLLKLNRDLNGVVVAFCVLQAIGIATLLYFHVQKTALANHRS